jgi:hypothetical protein
VSSILGLLYLMVFLMAPKRSCGNKSLTQYDFFFNSRKIRNKIQNV